MLEAQTVQVYVKIYEKRRQRKQSLRDVAGEQTDVNATSETSTERRSYRKNDDDIHGATGKSTIDSDTEMKSPEALTVA